jgi:Tol biopolymer transport system component
MTKLHRFALAVSVTLVPFLAAAPGRAAEPAACAKDADCDDDNPCTKDKCDQNTGHCEFRPHDFGNHYGQPIACDDGNACTSGDACHVGVCAGGNVPDGTACDDTVTCSGPDTCQAGVCTVPGALVEKIAFASTRDNPTADPQVAGAEVYLMDPSGDHLARLTTNQVFSDAFPALSPDGKGRIVFDSNRNNASSDPVNLVDLFLMKGDGSHQQYLARGTSASWSPDSRRITFQRSASGTGLPINPLPGAPAADSDIFVASVCDLLAGEPPTNITITDDPLMLKIDVDPDWSSDGQKIVFTRSDVGDHPQTPTSSEIWVMNADGSNPVQLTHNQVEERGPAWSPDGTRITYACKQGTTSPNADLEVCVMNADGSGQTQLTFNTLNDAAPKFSPDGRKIVWNHAVGAGAGNHIWVMNPDGTDQTPITVPATGTDPSTGTNLFPDWGFVRQ